MHHLVTNFIVSSQGVVCGAVGICHCRVLACRFTFSRFLFRSFFHSPARGLRLILPPNPSLQHSIWRSVCWNIAIYLASFPPNQKGLELLRTLQIAILLFIIRFHRLLLLLLLLSDQRITTGLTLSQHDYYRV